MGKDQTVPCGPDSRLDVFQAINCLATIIVLPGQTHLRARGRLGCAIPLCELPSGSVVAIPADPETKRGGVIKAERPRDHHSPQRALHFLGRPQNLTTS